MVKKTILLVSEDTFSIVKINNGELISYKNEGVEYIHQKEDKGWNNSDIEMFPVIGPTIINNYKVSTPKGDALLDQHGLLRLLDYKLVKNDKKNAHFKKIYKKNTFLNNIKFPNKSTEEFVYWPYDFSFEKIFKLTNNSLEITLLINSEKYMPFMLGYHPAFKLSKKSTEFLTTVDKKITLQDVFLAGSEALPVLNISEITLHNTSKKNVKMSIDGFNNFMLWAEFDNMICIEPITQYPSLKTQKYSDKNMNISKGENSFSVTINIE